MEKKVSNRIIILLLMVLIILVLCIPTMFVLYKKGIIAFDKVNESSDSTSAIEDNEAISDNSKVNTDDSVDLSDKNEYLGFWYENGDYDQYVNSNQLIIKEISEKMILIDLYISRTTQIKNLSIDLNNYKGTYSSAGSEDDGKLYNGTVEIKKDKIVVVFEGKTIVFTYHIKNGDISSYKGEWYESEEYQNYRNPNSLNIKSVENNKIVIDFYITRTAQVDDVTVYINDGIGNFAVKSDYGYVEGMVTLKDNTPVLLIGKNEIQYLEVGSSYTFKYKK